MSYPYAPRDSLPNGGVYSWPAPQPRGVGEAAAYDAQFDGGKPMSVAYSADGGTPGPMHGYSGLSGPTMRSYPGGASAQRAGPVNNNSNPYAEPQPAMSAPTLVPLGSQMAPGSQPMAPYYSQSSSPMAPGDHVVVGGLKRGYLAPGSYVHSNKKPASILCPQCHQQIITKVDAKVGARTLVAAAAICAVYWPLAFIPFVAKPLKKRVHSCTRCGHKIGKVVTVTPA
ncbi:hypothetical protein GGF46_000820 [Coemansia sp. RSA 552]|nr:hypothetical protein GGF46_000820 [Coemansia sp. RSA 552]